MAQVLQLRRGTTAQNDTFTGAAGEVTVDTDRKSLRVHDGLTMGGKEIADLATAIPLLTDATTVNAADELIIQQGGITKRATGAELAKGLNVLNGQFRVSDYGAVGDGTTNDRNAIQAAIDAANSAGGGYVMFDAKTYIIGSPRLGWRSNVILCGTGSTVLKVANGIDGLVIGHNSSDAAAPVVNVGAIGIVFDGNRDNAPKVTATSVVSLDPVDGAYFERCVFRNATGYGMSMQWGTPSNTPNNDRVKNVTFVKCDFKDNGFGVSGTVLDGIDVKNCNGLSFYNCSATGNGLDGFDFRGENVCLIDCTASNNGGSGIEISANGNGANQNSSLTIYGGRYFGNEDGINIANNPSGGTGFTNVSVTGATFSSNDRHGVRASSANSNTRCTFTSCFVSGNGGNGFDLAATGTKHFSIGGCIVRANTGDGVYVNNVDCTYIDAGTIENNGGWGIFEHTTAGRNSYGAVNVRNNASGSVSRNGNLSMVSPMLRDYAVAGSAPSDIIPSASNINLPAGGHTFFVTGTTNIDSLALSHRGRIVTLIFKGVLTVNDGAVGGNLKLAGNLTTVADSTLTLVCNTTVWLEVSRSVN